MKKLILIGLLAFCSNGVADEGSVYYERINAAFTWDGVFSLDEYKRYTFEGHGVGLQTDVLQYEEFRIRTNTHLVQGNYGVMYGAGVSAFPLWSITRNLKLAPEYNLGFDLFSTNSFSPYKSTQLNFSSKIGPKLKYKDLEVGAYVFYSDSLSGVNLSGTSLQVNYTIWGY
jgi:hypothetical protein